MLLLAWYSLVSALLLLTLWFTVEAMIPEKKIVLLLGNDRDTVDFSLLRFFSCSHTTGSLEYRKTAKTEPKPLGVLFVRSGARRLCRERKKMARKIGPTESVPAEGFILDCTHYSQLL